MSKVCIVVTYFGAWPDYAPLFFESCRQNPEIDFLVFTDCGRIANIPENVQLIDTTLGKVVERIEDVLQISTDVRKPFKLCDFRPAFYQVFEEYLSSYDFWGVSDLDVVLGDIRGVLEKKVFDTYDIIATRPWYITGHFFLFRNAPHVNHLYKKSKDWKKVFRDRKYYNFDECNGAHMALREDVSIFEVDTEIESITEVARREEQSGRLSVYDGELARESLGGKQVHWQRGHVYEGDKEFLLFHFVVLKSNVEFAFPQWRKAPENFVITQNGVYRPNESEGLRYLWATEKSKILKQSADRLLKKLRRRV